jgi:hypothetical protein
MPFRDPWCATDPRYPSAPDLLAEPGKGAIRDRNRPPASRHRLPRQPGARHECSRARGFDIHRRPARTIPPWPDSYRPAKKESESTHTKDVGHIAGGVVALARPSMLGTARSACPTAFMTACTCARAIGPHHWSVEFRFSSCSGVVRFWGWPTVLPVVPT